MQRIRTLRLALLAIAACLWAAGCAAGPQPGAGQAVGAPSPAVAAPNDASLAALAPPGPTLGSQRAGELFGWLASTPAQPVRGAALIDAYLVDAGGRAVTDAKVTFDTDMTNMSHGKYLVPAAGAGDGHYAGQVRFSMPGPWRIIAIVERPGRETARLRFEFRVSAR